MAFSEITIQALTDAGWRPERHINIQPYDDLLRAEGYPVFQVLLDFLFEFGGLHVNIPHPKVSGARDQFHFDLPEAINGIVPERVADYSERIGSPLSVIGEASRGHQVRRHRIFVLR